MKRGLIIGLIIVILALGGYLISLSLSNQEEKTLAEKIEECPDDNIDTNYKNSDCIINLATGYKNESVCENIRPSGGSAGVGSGLDCLIKTYIAMGDINNCDKLRYTTDQEYCRNSIVN